MIMITPKIIRDLQKRRGLTTKALADELGVKMITVFQWKSGRRHPKYDMQIKLNKMIEETAKAQVA